MIKDIDFKNWADNSENFSPYEDRSSGSFRRFEDTDKILNKIHKTNWSSESDYYNTVRVNGKNTTRTLKFKK